MPENRPRQAQLGLRIGPEPSLLLACRVRNRVLIGYTTHCTIQEEQNGPGGGGTYIEGTKHTEH